MMICGVFRPTREFFSHMETSPMPVKGCKFWPLFGTHEQWGFLNSVLWHGASVYNGHLREPVTLTPIAESLAVELSLPVFARRKAILGLLLCSLRKCANNEELTRPYTVQVRTKMIKIDRTLLKLEQYRKWVDLTLLKLEQNRKWVDRTLLKLEQ